ncbi:Altered inheritance of mitochondria protein 1 [Cytospora mali]|uniref:Altered inheritance of mitochondria protein 1 n=1 Tax=Cytospora mali TaxID=578113 RepID=A0A194VKH8_CYTMA|nr:Altered inheritance of mitochondria protein 1 [Valsa mali]
MLCQRSSPGASVPVTESEPTSSALEKPDFLNEAESTIWDRLVTEFNPVELVVQDISGGCGSMYGIEVSSEKFRGANMLKQQRMVNAVLGDLMKGWHGVQLKTRVP